MEIKGKVYTSYRNWLMEEWQVRQSHNPKFTLRAFSKYLGVSPASLSQVLAGKRGFSSKNLEAIAFKLELTPEERNSFKRSVSKERYQEPQPELMLQIKEDTFRLISDWYHYAILALTAMEDCQNSPSYLSRRLGITYKQSHESIRRLKRLGLITIEQDKIVNTQKGLLSMIGQSPSQAVRRFHKGNLKLAEASLDNVPVDQREFSAITIPVNPHQIEEARKLATQFRRDMKRLLQKGESKEVYTLSVQLFPVTKRVER